jgi:hypothetical protein
MKWQRVEDGGWRRVIEYWSGGGSGLGDKLIKIEAILFFSASNLKRSAPKAQRSSNSAKHFCLYIGI